MKLMTRITMEYGEVIDESEKNRVEEMMKEGDEQAIFEFFGIGWKPPLKVSVAYEEPANE